MVWSGSVTAASEVSIPAAKTPLFIGANANSLCVFVSETRHPDGSDQSHDGEGGTGPRFAVCCRPPRLRRHTRAGGVGLKVSSN